MASDSATRIFDQDLIRAEANATRRLFYWLMVGPGIGCLALCAYSLRADPAWWSPNGPGTIVGVAILGSGLVILPTIAWLAVNPLLSVEISDSTILLKFRRRNPKSFEWADSSLNGVLTRVTEAEPSGKSGGSNAWQLTISDSSNQASAWISSEAGASLIEFAERAGKLAMRKDMPWGSRKGSPLVFTTASLGPSQDIRKDVRRP